MVPATVNFSVLIKIDEVHQQLVTREADKTGRVPAHSGARPRGEHRNLAAVDLQPALKAEKNDPPAMTGFSASPLATKSQICQESLLFPPHPPRK